MNTPTRTLIRTLAALTGTAVSFAAIAHPDPDSVKRSNLRELAAGAHDDPWASTSPLRDRQPVIQLAILLDTSGSMQGLINQARARIWDVVNDLAKARRGGERPRLEVALYQYGSDHLPSSEGFLTLTQPFTTDLDLLSERLFSLRVDGSAEYCGWTLQAAMKELDWDRTPLTVPMIQQPLRVIVIAGNEPFTQGPIDYRAPAQRAADRGVIVNTVYCGDAREGESTGWFTAAQLGRGAYLSINHNAALDQVRCPQDEEILGLNTRLNDTYIPYGVAGGASKERQIAQDSANVTLSREAGVARAAAKSSAQYSNAHWDLLDAIEANTLDLDTAPTESLPDSFRTMTIAERKSEVDRLRTERDALRDRIRILAAERERFLAEHRRHHRPGHDTLDAAMIRAIREQARRLGFTYEPD